MAKSKKKKTTRPSQYEEKLSVKGSFMDIIKAAGKDAKNKSKKSK